MENIENVLKKNNIKTGGLKEGMEGTNLMGYLVDLLDDCIGSDSELAINILSAYHIGFSKTLLRYPWGILLNFWIGIQKQEFVVSLEEPKLVLEESGVILLPDLSSITFRKRKRF